MLTARSRHHLPAVEIEGLSDDAGRGIGRGIALALAAAGAKVVVNDYGVDIHGNVPTDAPANEVVGEIKWNGGLIYVSETLAGEQVAVEEADNGEWKVRIYAHPLGVIDIRHMKLRRRNVLPPRGQDVATQTTPEL